MSTFDHFIRFFFGADSGLAFPKNGNLPTDAHGAMPVVAGDRLRFLVDRADLGGLKPEALSLRIRSAQTGALLAGSPGLIRRQDAEGYSEIRVRINNAVADGDYRQFALLAEVPNPAYRMENLALNRPVAVSSTLDYSGNSASALTDGVAQYGGPFWTSQGEIYRQHDEFMTVTLPEPGQLSGLTLWPHYAQPDASLHFPVDMNLSVSTDGGATFRFIRRWIGLPAPADGKAVDFDLPDGVQATHVRLDFSNLRFNPVDTTYRVQLGEVILNGYRLSKPPTVTANLLGTFRGQQARLPDYIAAIRQFFEGYLYAPVVVDQDGSELTIRIYHSGRFQLGNAAVRVGIGRVNEQNENQPVMSARPAGPLSLPAKTSYRVVVGTDIEAGNVFTLGPKTYTASGNETPDALLSALGVADNHTQVAAGTTPVVSADVGSYNSDNKNKPAITLLYDSTSGSTDYYKATVGPDVQPGNTYQISCEGQATRTKIATGTDTAATIAAYFNNLTGAKFSVGIGKLPVGLTQTGSQTLANTNAPTLKLTGRQEIAAKTLDQWVITLSGSIQPGNTYHLRVGSGPETIAVAGADDTALDLAGKFGYNQHPFTVSVATGAGLTAYAEPGPRYREPDHVADVTVLASPVRYPNLPWVGEVNWSQGLPMGWYQLVLTELGTATVVAESNYLNQRPTGKDTILLRYGDRGRVFGYHYAEYGLIQQIRIPAGLSEGRLQQDETLGKAFDGQTLRGRTRSEVMRTLTTRAAPESFHRALWAALKHAQVWIDGVAYQQRGEYVQGEVIGRRRKRMQASAQVVDLASMRGNTADFSQSASGSLSAGWVGIGSIVGPDDLPVYLQSGSIVVQIKAGMSLSPGVYKLLVRTGHEVLTIAAYIDGIRAGQSVLTPVRLNRIDQDLILTAGSELSIRMQPAGMDSPVSSQFQEHSAESAYSVEFDSTYFQ